eukprot:jgi/Chrzof1/3453/Cz12g26050.t1
MGLKTKDNSLAIIKKLALFIPSYYLIYYLVSVVLVGSFRLPWESLGSFPFRTAWYEFNPAAGDPGLAGWLAMPITYLLSVSLAYLVVACTRKTWDYATTTSILHWVICCAVNRAFPVNWIWWLTIILCSVGLSLLGEVFNYYLRDMKDIQLVSVWHITVLQRGLSSVAC